MREYTGIVLETRIYEVHYTVRAANRKEADAKFEVGDTVNEDNETFCEVQDRQVAYDTIKKVPKLQELRSASGGLEG